MFHTLPTFLTRCLFLPQTPNKKKTFFTGANRSLIIWLACFSCGLAFVMVFDINIGLFKNDFCKSIFLDFNKVYRNFKNNAKNSVSRGRQRATLVPRLCHKAATPAIHLAGGSPVSLHSCLIPLY